MLPLAKHVAAALKRRESAVMVTVVNSRGVDNGVKLGAKLLISANGVSHGSLGSEELDRAACEQAANTIEEGEPGLKQYLPDGTPAPRRSRAYVQLLYEPLLPPDRLVVIGAGHIAVPLHEIGRILDFEVVVVDDRADFATRERFPHADEVLCIPFGTVPAQIAIDRTTYLVLVTRAHEHDEEVLMRVADSPAPYIGMIGSKRRVLTVYRRLLEEGVTPEQLARVYAPVGLAINARTPQEIAVAVMAEIVSVKRHGKGNHSALRELPRSLQTVAGAARPPVSLPES
ncbi:MAG: XdhC/CoxI family protein [Chloroflexota bacterium]|nr:XdhC/CoxI family protein [Chloroflexota bacterium]MDE2840827.1 XdhC/CoxI family protein [Chloroflexota bacterium]